MYAPIAWLWFAVAMACYFCKASGSVSVIGILVIASMLVTFFLLGGAFVRIALGSGQRFSGVPVRLLIGALLSNIVFYLVALLLPFGLPIDWLVVMGIALTVSLAVKRKSSTDVSERSDGTDLIFALVSTVAVMIWCLDILPPIKMTGSVAILKTWMDVYYHMGEIGSLANSTGVANMHDLQMAGAQVHPYHLASYYFPALIQRLTGVPTWVAYAGVLVPFGLLLTACAAFSLALPVFGRWPALVAGLSVLLIPDAYHQGFGNQLVGGYQWMQQIGPAGTYGVASAATAFLFLFEASRTGRLALVAIGYFFVIVTLLFKAQIFVAIALPAFLFPALFMGHLSWKRRTGLVLSLAAVFLAVVGVSQSSPNVPVMRLDGSGLKFYSSLVMIISQNDGIIKSLSLAAMSAAKDSWILRASIFALVLVVTTFGFVAPLCLFVFFRTRKTHSAAVTLFPALVTAVYIVMSTCLSADTKRLGTPEELLNRPFVWAYFALLVWTVAGICQWLCRDNTRPSPRARYSLIVLILCLLAVPIQLHSGVATFKAWDVGPQELPVCQVKAANFLRTESKPRDVIQDSLNDRHFILTGLSGRQLFAIDSSGVRAPTGVDTRIASLKMVKNLRSPSQVDAFMKENGIIFYVTNPDDSVAWKYLMDDHKVFQCDQYSIYRF